jgi:hypothetical protein
MVTKLPKLLKCSICKKEIPPHPIHGWAGGNNAAPINDGRCCDNCNSMVVIPARLQRLFEQRED